MEHQTKLPSLIFPRWDGHIIGQHVCAFSLGFQHTDSLIRTGASLRSFFFTVLQCLSAAVMCIVKQERHALSAIDLNLSNRKAQ